MKLLSLKVSRYRSLRDERIELVVRLKDEEGKTYEWSIRLTREGHEFAVQEHVEEVPVSSKPDEIQNPKLHLKNLLGDRVYTVVISEEIAKRLNAQTIAQRSPSFQGFLDAGTNGNRATEVSGAHEVTV